MEAEWESVGSPTREQIEAAAAARPRVLTGMMTAPVHFAGPYQSDVVEVDLTPEQVRELLDRAGRGEVEIPPELAERMANFLGQAGESN